MADSSLPVCNSLWLGGKLGPIEAACLSSFVRHGHRVVLHVYDDVGGVPTGVEVVSGEETLPRERIIRYKENGSYALFANLFRYELLARSKGIWIDCDLYCLRPMAENGDGYIFGWESEYLINTAILALPPTSPILRSLIELFDAKSPVWPWMKPGRRIELQKRRDAGEVFGVEEAPWASTGPQALTFFLRGAGLAPRAEAREVFYPLRYEHTALLFRADFDVAQTVTPRTRTVHLWHSAFAKEQRQVERGSAIDRLASEGTLFDETALNKMSEPASRPPAQQRPANSILIAASGWKQEAWSAPIKAAQPRREVLLWPQIPDRSRIAYALLWNPPANVLDGLANIRVVFSLGAGVDALVARSDLPPNIPVVRVVDDDLTQRMTEWVVLQVLMHHRRQRWYDGEQAAHRWRIPPQPAAHEVRVGVMGMGVFGQATARVLVALGFDVAGWSRTRHDIANVRSFAGVSELAAFLARTDILVSLLPLTHETRGILSMPLFRKLARDGKLGPPIVINAGRGGLQVERDIIAAIDDGTLGGASLDVFEREPLDPQSPLWQRRNVVITPHVAGASAPNALVPGILRQIDAFERGEPLKNVVDRLRGY